jgi:hypothetical protein
MTRETQFHEETVSCHQDQNKTEKGANYELIKNN